MTYRELTRKLRSLGCEFDRQSRGSHEIWRNPANGTRRSYCIQLWLRFGCSKISA
ncbi:MAG: type II toxin-antitoxin system HicA family toxin [bacterium]|nr:type II toxin-antitoxin system HicA family toxin [bacterium]